MYVPITDPVDQKRAAEIVTKIKELKNISTTFLVLSALCCIGIIFFSKLLLLFPELGMTFIMGRIYRQMQKLGKELQNIIIKYI